MEERSALLLVDVQNDFCPGGSLAVERGDLVVPVLNEWIRRFEREGKPIIASRDWHPVETTHFQQWGGPWPPHCVQATRGAEFHPDLNLPASATVVSKGMDPNRDSYSAFQGIDPAGHDLARLLRDLGVERLYVGGLATDYCVKSSVIDALREGFKVTVIEDAIRAVNVNPGDEVKAKEAMRAAGAEFTRTPQAVG